MELANLCTRPVKSRRRPFCAHFMQTYIEYDPKVLPWPELDAASLRRLQSVPFWEEVFYTERRAGAIVAAVTRSSAPPVERAEVEPNTVALPPIGGECPSRAWISSGSLPLCSPILCIHADTFVGCDAPARGLHPKRRYRSMDCGPPKIARC
jgi:hypothetical protein